MAASSERRQKQHFSTNPLLYSKTSLFSKYTGSERKLLGQNSLLTSSKSTQELGNRMVSRTMSEKPPTVTRSLSGVGEKMSEGGPLSSSSGSSLATTTMEGKLSTQPSLRSNLTDKVKFSLLSSNSSNLSNRTKHQLQSRLHNEAKSVSSFKTSLSVKPSMPLTSFTSTAISSPRQTSLLTTLRGEVKRSKILKSAEKIQSSSPLHLTSGNLAGPQSTNLLSSNLSSNLTSNLVDRAPKTQFSSKASAILGRSITEKTLFSSVNSKPLSTLSSRKPLSTFSSSKPLSTSKPQSTLRSINPLNISPLVSKQTQLPKSSMLKMSSLTATKSVCKESKPLRQSPVSETNLKISSPPLSPSLLTQREHQSTISHPRSI